MKMLLPMVIRHGVLDMQVCVPKGWPDKQVKYYADSANESGTANGWSIRKKGSKYLAGDEERVQCEERKGCVHIMLDC